MVAFVHELILLVQVRLGVALSAVGARINKRLCACVMRTGKHNLPLEVRKYAVLLQMEMKKDVYSINVKFIPLKKLNLSS